MSPANANDGNTSTYWESTDGAAYPQTITVNLGAVYPIGSLTLDLPPSTAWATRTETLSVLGSTNGTSFSQIVGLGRVHLQPVHRQHGDDQPAVGDQRPVRRAELHRQHRLDRRPAVGVRGLPRQRWRRRRPTSSPLTASPSSVSFGSRRSGRPARAQTVTVSNPNSTAVSVSSVSASGPFSRDQHLRQLHRRERVVHGQRDVHADRERLGLRQPVGGVQRPGSPLTVALSGTGTSSGPTSALTASPSSVSFGSETVGSTTSRRR